MFVKIHIFSVLYVANFPEICARYKISRIFTTLLQHVTEVPPPQKNEQKIQKLLQSLLSTGESIHGTATVKTCIQDCKIDEDKCAQR